MRQRTVVPAWLIGSVLVLTLAGAFLVIIALYLMISAGYFVTEPPSPIHAAALRNDLHVLRKELGVGTSPDLPTKNMRHHMDGNTPLMLAASKGHVEAVAMLLDHGANPRTRNVGGATAIHYAVYRDAPEIIELLVEAGGDVDARNVHGLTPLMQAAGYGSAEQLRVLLLLGADPSARDKAGKTALDIALEMGREDAAAILREVSPP